jgi:hypothetical protein
MKRNLVFLSLIVILTLAVSLAYAGTAKTMSVNVPFEFYVEDQLLPAGEYKFEMSGAPLAAASVVTVRTINGTGIRFLLTRSEIDTGLPQSHLRFNQYDEKRFLSSVSIGDYKANVTMFSLEKEIRIGSTISRTITLVAQK